MVNGENAAGIGVLPGQVEEMFDAGADVVTLGNHTWGKMKITRYLDDCAYLLRPANFAQRLPGQGYGVFDGPMGLQIGVINLIGRVSMDPNVDNPFRRADQILGQLAGRRTCSWWTSTLRPPARNWPWAGTWTGGFRRSGAPIPTCPRRTP